MNASIQVVKTNPKKLDKEVKDIAGNLVDEDYLNQLYSLVSWAADAIALYSDDELEEYSAKTSS